MDAPRHVVLRTAATLLVTVGDGSSIPTATHLAFSSLRRPDNKGRSGRLLSASATLHDPASGTCEAKPPHSRSHVSLNIRQRAFPLDKEHNHASRRYLSVRSSRRPGPRLAACGAGGTAQSVGSKSTTQGGGSGSSGEHTDDISVGVKPDAAAVKLLPAAVKAGARLRWPWT